MSGVISSGSSQPPNASPVTSIRRQEYLELAPKAELHLHSYLEPSRKTHYLCRVMAALDDLDARLGESRA